MCKGKCQNRCATIKCPTATRADSWLAELALDSGENNVGAGKSVVIDPKPRTFMRRPGQTATITITAPSGSGKTHMHQIISDALSAHGVVVSDVRVDPAKHTTEIFDVVAPASSGRVKPLADGSAAIIVGGGESPTYDELIEAGWIEPLTHPERTAQACEPVRIAIEGKTGMPCTTEQAGEIISIIASDVARQVVADIKSLAPVDDLELQMQSANRILDELVKEREGMGPKEFGEAHAKLRGLAIDGSWRELVKLVQKVGIANWTRGDFVVLTLERAQTIQNIGPRNLGALIFDDLSEAIDKARQ